MTLYEFNLLTSHQKVQFVDTSCTHLGTYAQDMNRLVSLYYASDYFIELQYNFSDNAIQSILAFRSTRRLERFLQQIKLDFEW